MIKILNIPVETMSNQVLITADKILPENVTQNVRSNSNGAVITFLGTTRNETKGRKVLRLEYEAYEPMASQKISEIISEVQEKFSVSDISICHRIGTIEIGEISLVVSVSSPHRKDSFNACQYVVDRIKEIVPIWKKEIFLDGEEWVESI